MKKILIIALALALALASVSALAVTVGVPNDPTNEARALLLLQTYGYIKLEEGAGITATKEEIEENPAGIEFNEVAAEMVPNILPDVDYAIINNNYALDAGLSPTADSLLIESADSPYVNVVTVREDNVDTPETKALIAAVASQQVKDYITATWPDGSVVAVVEDPTDGYDADVDYEALAGTTISIACSPTPHALILAVAKEILAAKDITLDIIEYSDYVQPDMVVESGEVYANYFAHIPYQENFNEENGTHLVNVAGIHIEPMALYGGKQTDLTALSAQ